MDIIDHLDVMSDKELLKVTGGASSFSASLLSAIIKGINTLYELGRSLGTAIRREQENKLCEI